MVSALTTQGPKLDLCQEMMLYRYVFFILSSLVLTMSLSAEIASARAFQSSHKEIEFEIKHCRRFGGTVLELQMPYPQLRAVSFCYFSANQGMDLHTLYVSRYNTAGPLANQAYHRTVQPTLQACQLTGGEIIRTSSKEVCLFWDDSAIDNKALENGMSSPWNRELNHALGF